MTGGPILITGATGFVGRHVVPALLANGHRLRLAIRDPARLDSGWRERVEACVVADLAEGPLEPLVEGVEQLRLRYWLEGAAQPVSASALTPDQWASVAAVDLCVLVRGAAPVRAVTYVDCDGVASVPGDGRARQAFWRHVAIRNRPGAPL